MSLQFNPAAIYYSSRPIEEGARAPRKIGLLWNRLRELMAVPPRIEEREKIDDCLERLGVTRSDEEARRLLIPMIQNAFHYRVKIVPCQHNSGVYFLSLNEKRFAVFKVGEKRARMELLVRHLAHRLGLEKYAVPGLFCSIQYPRFPKEDTIVELYNGNQKVFGKNPEKDNFGVQEPYTITGILEPYFEKGQTIELDDFVRTTLLALAAGLRDAKPDGMAGPMHLDTEDSMPPRFLPEDNLNRKVAATHLPYLEHPLAFQPITVDIWKRLQLTVDNWDLEQLLQDLSFQKIEFADLSSEDLPVGDVGFDHGGCYAAIEPMHEIFEKQVRINLNQTASLLTRSQKEAFLARMTRIRDFFDSFLLKERSVTVFDMVCAVDLHFARHVEALKLHGRDREPVMHIVGRYTPEQSNSPLSQEPSRGTPSPPQLMGASGDSSARHIFDFKTPIPVRGEEKELPPKKQEH